MIKVRTFIKTGNPPFFKVGCQIGSELFQIILTIFYLAGFKFFLPTYWVYIIDYTLRIVIIVLLLPDVVTALKHKTRFSFFGLFIFTGLMCWGLFTFSIFFPHDWYNDLDRHFFRFPPYPDIRAHWLYTFDLTIGLLLVALSEEVFFRYKLNQYFEQRNFRVPTRALLTSLLFAGMHYRLGPLGLIETFIIGTLFYLLFYKTGSIRYPVVTHYFYNLIIFGMPALID